MHRREWLKLLGGAAAVAALPLPLPEALKEQPTVHYFSGPDKAFVGLEAPEAVRAGEFMLLDTHPLGVVQHDAAPGEYVLVQVYGHSKVAVNA